jgi:hypothetical protein
MLPPPDIVLQRNIDARAADHEARWNECGHAASEWLRFRHPPAMTAAPSALR